MTPTVHLCRLHLVLVDSKAFGQLNLADSSVPRIATYKAAFATVSAGGATKCSPRLGLLEAGKCMPSVKYVAKISSIASDASSSASCKLSPEWPTAADLGKSTHSRCDPQ